MFVLRKLLIKGLWTINDVFQKSSTLSPPPPLQKKKIATTTTAIDYETQTGLSWHSCKQANPVNPEI